MLLVSNGIAPACRVNAGNFTIAEDGFLVHAFVIVSTNAAVGTDQDGKMFWTKITEDFVRRGRGPSQTSNSLKTRFNRTLQHDVNKYIGHLQGALCKYHSGWVIADYTNEANDNFERVGGTYMFCSCDVCCVKFLLLLPNDTNTQLTSCWFRKWKHAHVHEILRRGLPKFELVTRTMHRRILDALFLLDCGRMSPESGIDDDDDEEDAVGVDVRGGNVAVPPAIDSSLVVVPPTPAATARGFDITPRPYIGKKRAQQLAQQAAAIKLKKTKKDDLPEHTMHMCSTQAVLLPTKLHRNNLL
jgi:hypothetical protein